MSSVETVSASERRLNAAIPQQAIRGEVAARLGKIGRTAKISGFRPGKIPTKVLESLYGAEAYREALGEVLSRCFLEEVRHHQLRVIGQPKFEISASNDAQVEYSATFEVYPDVVMGDLSGETVERLACELTLVDVQNTIDTLRKQRITYQEVARAAQAEDRVCIDFSGKIEGEIFEGGEDRDHTLVLGAGRMLPEFERAITGMSAGESKSFDMTYPAEYPNQAIAGKQVSFALSLHKVEAPNLPALDAGFAESVGIEGGNVDTLEGDIQVNLQREVVRRLKDRNKAAAMNALLRASKFGVSGSLVEAEANNIRQKTSQEMESRGLKLEDAGLTQAALYENAESRVKLGLIIADLMQKNDLHARPEQIRALVDDYAQSFDQPEEVVSWFYNDASQLKEGENLVTEDNIVAWTMARTTTVDRNIAFNELMGR